MTSETQKIIYAQRQEASFQTVVDDACRILEYKQAEYHIRRLRELDLILEDMEKQLDVIIEDQKTVFKNREGGLAISQEE